MHFKICVVAVVVVVDDDVGIVVVLIVFYYCCFFKLFFNFLQACVLSKSVPTVCNELGKKWSSKYFLIKSEVNNQNDSEDFI